MPTLIGKSFALIPSTNVVRSNKKLSKLQQRKTLDPEVNFESLSNSTNLAMSTRKKKSQVTCQNTWRIKGCTSKLPEFQCEERGVWRTHQIV